MRILVIFAHPVETSFGAVVNQRVIMSLCGQGHEVRGLDLYDCGFEPVLTRHELLAYFEVGDHRKPLDDHISLIKWAEGMIFVYPTWWYGLPAILKGWFDRVWLPKIAFELSDTHLTRSHLMRNIRLLGGISTYGASWWWTRWVGDPGRRTIMRGVKPLCAVGCRTFWLALYDMDKSTNELRSAFLKRIERKLSRL